MKSIVMSLALLGLAASAHARSPRPQLDTQEFAVEVCTSTTLTVSSTANTDMINGSVSLSSATAIEIYNADDSIVINCGYDALVSTISARNAYGREIGPNIGYVLQINQDKIPYNCEAQSGSPRVTVTKCR